MYIVIIILIVLLAYLWHEKNQIGKKLDSVSKHEYEHRYKELFENSSDAIFIVEIPGEREFRFESLNSAARHIFDSGHIGFEGQLLSKIIHHSHDVELLRTLSELSSRVGQAVHSGMPIKYESTIRHAPEEVLETYEVSLVPMAEDGGITHVLCFAKKITAIKLYEQELQGRLQLEEKLSGFADSAPGFFYSFRHGTDGSNTMPFASVGINDLFGLHQEDVTTNISAMTLLIHRDDLKSFIEAIACSAAELAPLTVEFRAQHPVKGELWIAMRAMPIEMLDRSVMWHGFMHDITERKLNELRLKDTQEKLRELVLSRETLREEERKRIAWEMHEELGQLLASMKMRVYGMRTQLPKGLPAFNEDSRILTGLIDKSIKTIRDIVSNLRPSVLQLGLDAGLEWLVEEFNKHSDINCSMEIEQDRKLVSDELTTLVFRVVQELLENIARQEGVSDISVVWVNNQNQKMLTIRHDGDVIADENSLSYFGIQERVAFLDGEMRMFSELEHRSVIEITFPVGEVAGIQYPLFGG